MAKEGTVAPKERINVTFKPATGGTQAAVGLQVRDQPHRLQVDLTTHNRSL